MCFLVGATYQLDAWFTGESPPHEIRGTTMLQVFRAVDLNKVPGTEEQGVPKGEPWTRTLPHPYQFCW